MFPLWPFLRWTARLASLASLGVLLLFIAGEGFNPAKLAPRELALSLFFPLGVMLGLGLGWWREGVGGVMALAGLAGFYGVHYAVAGGFPRGWALAVFTLPGLLFLLSWLLNPSKKGADVRPDDLNAT